MKMRASLLTGLLPLTCACVSAPPGDLYQASSVPLAASPQHSLAISGVVDRRVSVPEIVARYSTAIPQEEALRTPSCEAWINRLEGVAGPRNIEVHIPTRIKGGVVQASVQVDRYQPGRCNWVLSEIRVVVRGPSGQTSAQRIALGAAYERARFYAIRPTGKPNNNVVFTCSQKEKFFCSPHMGGPDGVEVLVDADTSEITFQEQQSE